MLLQVLALTDILRATQTVIVNNSKGTSKTHSIEYLQPTDNVRDIARNNGKAKPRMHIEVRHHHLVHYVNVVTATLRHATSNKIIVDGLTNKLKTIRPKTVHQHLGMSDTILPGGDLKHQAA